MPSEKDTHFLKRLKKAGWKEVRITGSHHILVKDGCLPVTVPVHGKDLPQGLWHALKKQTGLP